LRRQRTEAKEEAARQKERERKQAIDKAQATLNEAEREHTKREAGLLEAIERKVQADAADWHAQRSGSKRSCGVRAVRTAK
jgi:hypothetical protein